MNEIIEVGQDPTPARSVPAVTTPATLLQMAVAQGADLDKLERLMALQERWEANEARKAFDVAMARFKAEPMKIEKRKKVDFKTRDGDRISYNHAELSDVTDVIGPAMAKHGLSYRWTIDQSQRQIRVECIVAHERGHSERVAMSAEPDASGKKNAIQQVGSTVTYLSRYTLLAATGMSTAGMDDDGKGGKSAKEWDNTPDDRPARRQPQQRADSGPTNGPVSAGQRKYLEQQAAQLNIALPDLCGEAGINWESLTTDGFAVLKDRLAEARRG